MLRRKQQTNQPMKFSQKSGGQSATPPKTNSTQNLGAAGLRKLLFAAGIASLCASCQSPQAPTATTPGASPGTSPAATPRRSQQPRRPKYCQNCLHAPDDRQLLGSSSNNGQRHPTSTRRNRVQSLRRQNPNPIRSLR